MVGRKANTTRSSKGTGAKAHSTAASKVSPSETGLGSAKKPVLAAHPQPDVDRAALREDIMKRFPKIRAALAK
jgi:hypothetical protein